MYSLVDEKHNTPVNPGVKADERAKQRLTIQKWSRLLFSCVHRREQIGKPCGISYYFWQVGEGRGNRLGVGGGV